MRSIRSASCALRAGRHDERNKFTTITMNDFSTILAAATEIEEGAGEAWKFLLRAGVAAIFSFGAFKLTRESAVASWKLYLNSVLIAAALAFIFGGGNGRDMGDYDGLRSFGSDGDTTEYVEVSKSKKIESFLVLSAAMVVGVVIGNKARNKEGNPK